MCRSGSIRGLAAMGGILAMFGAPTVAHSQNPFFQFQPGLNPAQAAFNQSLFASGARSFIPGAFGFNQGLGRFGSPTINPYAGNALTPSPFGATISSATTPITPGLDQGGLNDPYNNPYGMPYYGYGESPIGGYMRGYADVINSVTQGMVNEQQSFMMREYVKREKMDNQRRAFDNWLYYREKMPTAEDDRQRDLAMQVRRALNDPPAGDVYSGRAMNILLDDLGKKLARDPKNSGWFDPPLIRADVEKHLNFTGQENKGNPGILKFASTDDGRLPWPIVLTGPQFKADRALLDRLTRTVYKEAEAGKVDPGNLESMTAAVRTLQQSLANNIRDLTPSQYGEARRFLSDFDDALTLLRQPNARDYFGSKAPNADTIGKLTNDMLTRGLRFAPATAGDEATYVAVHRALVMYASNGSATVATEKTSDK